MKAQHYISACLAMLLISVMGDDFAAAQTSGGVSQVFSAPGSRFGQGRSLYSQRPTLSPYLNLLRSNGGPVLNYYGLVRPEQNFRAQTDQFQQQFNQLERQSLMMLEQEQERPSNLGTTGHSVRFLSNRQGGSGSVFSTLTERDSRLNNLPPIPGSRIAPTGHASYFNNPGTYYPFPNRQ